MEYSLDRDARSHHFGAMSLKPGEGPRERKVMTRSMYTAVAGMVEEGCPHWWDLEEYEIVEDEPEPHSKTPVAC